MTARDRDEPVRARHQPVLVREVLAHLDLKPGLTVVDGTVGAGGHSRRILERIGPKGRLIGLDRDPMMLQFAAKVLDAPNCHLIHSSYADLDVVLKELQIDAVDRILLDLGLSSDQLADERRGFGFQAGGELDLRFDTSRGEPAWQLLGRISEEELARILHEYGEERYSRQIARAVVSGSKTRPIRTAEDLLAAVSAGLPVGAAQSARKHPATRVFQALRIAVNGELDELERALGQTLHDALAPGGLLGVISFHSLEDRIVKQAFRDTDRWQNLTSKPVSASPTEERVNPRSRTAKLRVAARR